MYLNIYIYSFLNITPLVHIMLLISMFFRADNPQEHASLGKATLNYEF